MTDEQIRPVPCCNSCGRAWEKTVPLVIVQGMNLCGPCLDKVVEKQRQQFRQWVQEDNNGKVN